MRWELAPTRELARKDNANGELGCKALVPLLIHRAKDASFDADTMAEVSADTPEASSKHACLMHALNMSTDSFRKTNVTVTQGRHQTVSSDCLLYDVLAEGPRLNGHGVMRRPRVRPTTP